MCLKKKLWILFRHSGLQAPNLSFYDRFCPLRHKLVVPTPIDESSTCLSLTSKSPSQVNGRLLLNRNLIAFVLSYLIGFLESSVTAFLQAALTILFLLNDSFLPNLAQDFILD